MMSLFQAVDDLSMLFNVAGCGFFCGEPDFLLTSLLTLCTLSLCSARQAQLVLFSFEKNVFIGVFPFLSVVLILLWKTDCNSV